MAKAPVLAKSMLPAEAEQEEERIMDKIVLLLVITMYVLFRYFYAINQQLILIVSPFLYTLHTSVIISATGINPRPRIVTHEQNRCYS